MSPNNIEVEAAFKIASTIAHGLKRAEVKHYGYSCAQHTGCLVGDQ